MRRLPRLQLAVVIGALAVTLSTPADAGTRDISRDTLAADDGWAAAGGGTTGGSTAADAHVFTVRSRAELVRALDGGSATPKIIRVAGTIDANTADNARQLDCDDYATGGYALKKYLAAYDPRTWGSAKPSGPQEEARQASAAHNACNSGSERDLTDDVGWTPTLHQKIDSAARADEEVARGAGAGRIP